MDKATTEQEQQQQRNRMTLVPFHLATTTMGQMSFNKFEIFGILWKKNPQLIVVHFPFTSSFILREMST